MTTDLQSRSSIGRAVRAQDSRACVDGHLQYAINHVVPDSLHAKVLRSTAPHARILRLNADRAERLAGVVGILSGADLASASINSHYGPVLPDRPLVAMDKVRFAGEPVAVVVAKDQDTAVEALSLIEVDYEQLPSALDPEAAIAPNAEPIHDNIPERPFLTFPDLIIDTHAGRNIFNHFKIRKGDVEAGFAEADQIFENTYRTPAQQHASLEPHIAICRIDHDRATVWSSTASPFTVRFQVAETLRLPQSHVRVITWNVGGAFGGKTYPRIEPLVAAASWKVGGRPVRLEFDRAEEFYTISRHSSVVTLRTGVRRDGTLTARKATVLWGAGAYADISPRVAKNGGYGAIGPYRVPNAWVDSYAVYTNVTPAGGFRGYGIPQVAWAYESQMDEMAQALGIDRLKMRERNALTSGDSFSTGQVVRDVHYDDLLRRVGERIRWDVPQQRPTSRLARGKGVAMSIKGTVTPSTSTASLKLNDDGSLNLLTSTTEIGQGSRTSLAQIAADSVGIPYEWVTPSYPDTDVTPWDQSTSSSRSTYSMGSAIRKAGAEIQRQLRELAANLLEVSPEDILVSAGRIYVAGMPEGHLSVGDVVRRAQAGNLLASGSFLTDGGLDKETGQGKASEYFFQAACGVEVEVDLETGSVRVLDACLDTYAGRVIHPLFAELQSEGNLTFGIGQSFFEEIVLQDGQVANASLADYMIPSIKDLPVKFQVMLLEDPSGEGAAIGLGESGAPTIAPAISNAIYAACGVRLRDLPLTPERVLRALQSKKAEDGNNP